MDWTAQEGMVDRQITLEHLRAFVAVAEAGGFQEAGGLIYRTQSAVTQSVKRLERALRCRLLRRGQGQITELTEDGLRLLPEARDILARLDHAVKLMRQPELKGHIVLGIQPSVNTEELQTAISSCMALNKGLRIQVISMLSHTLLELMDQGRIDVAIVCRNKEEAVAEGTTRYLLCTEPMVWVGRRNEDYSAVEEIPLIVSVEHCVNREAAEAALKQAGRAYYHSFISTSWEGVCSAAAQGFGVSALELSDVAPNHAVLTEEHGLPPLPQLRTELRTRSDTPVILQFCELIKGLPAFRDAREI